MIQHEWEIVILIINALIFLIFVIGAWWCKNMGEDIKALQRNHSILELSFVEQKAHEEGREKLQNERWSILNRDIGILLNRKINHGDSPEEESARKT